MKITNLRLETHADRRRAVAHVEWEDTPRPPRDIFFETEAEFAADLCCDPNAFVVAAAVPAMRFGERRLTVEGALCPQLYEDISLALATLREWFGPPRSAIRIEPSLGLRAPFPRAEPRAAVCFSGGVDSLALVRANRVSLPLDHPLSFKDGLIVYGLDMGYTADTYPTDTVRFDFVRRLLDPVACDAQLQVIPVYTNLKFLEPDYEFWVKEYNSAGLAAVALAFSPRLTDVSIGSNAWIGFLPPAGSHPMIDPYYSTAALRVHHAQTTMRRIDKVRLVADWAAAMANLRTCFSYPNSHAELNCGKCRKCIFTMLELLAVGKLAEAPTFPADDVTPDMLRTMAIGGHYSAGYFRELLDPLEGIGRSDLAHTIRRMLARYDSLAGRLRRRLTAAAKRFDARHLNGALRRWWSTRSRE